MFWLTLAVCLVIEISGATAVSDSCAIIAGKTWVLPKDARYCMFPLDASIRTNVSCTLAFIKRIYTYIASALQIIEVVNETLPGHLKGQLASVCVPSRGLKLFANHNYIFSSFLVREFFLSTGSILPSLAT